MPSRDRYDRLRRHFQELEANERARFLLEASVSTLAQGLEQAGQALADSLERVMQQEHRASGASEEARQPGAAEPETAQRQASRGGDSSSES
ncbi:MAG: hypothetical protein ABEL04_12165 [Salinibacter sp.]|uniref:hypothetical protein n=1 Tax=Salinibacter sp. TaxID=2065818 RepID=UPI0035D52820